jgi:hypothetical protein
MTRRKLGATGVSEKQRAAALHSKSSSGEYSFGVNRSLILMRRRRDGDGVESDRCEGVCHRT